MRISKVTIFALILSLLSFVSAASADPITLTNLFGTISISDIGVGGMGTTGSTTITSHGSELTNFEGITAPHGHSLGYVGFSTGVLESGSVLNGGVFSSTGSTFDVIGKGKFGQPKGNIFIGSFVGPIDWTFISQNKQERTYTLTGELSGTLWNGRFTTGYTTQTINILNKNQLNGGVGHIGLGSTSISAPEPGTLGLLGTGLVGIAGMFRRKYFS
jgi:hypothetical protein